ncbi:MAG: hypothetical protein P4L81_02085 [Candidatus Pacebacteria bacterium]|nr:hypothetical protein [Candidatus Paceibacterota bacterium]
MRQRSSLFIRLPSDLRSWISDHAINGHRSMNAVVIEALSILMFGRQEDAIMRRHLATVQNVLGSPGMDPDLVASKPRVQTVLSLPNEPEPTPMFVIEGEEIMEVHHRRKQIGAKDKS